LQYTGARNRDAGARGDVLDALGKASLYNPDVIPNECHTDQPLAIARRGDNAGMLDQW
jgi:hypothetical protein